jgi:hypothetical protein
VPEIPAKGKRALLYERGINKAVGTQKSNDVDNSNEAKEDAITNMQSQPGYNPKQELPQANHR